ncbi:MAG: GDP-mannose 4,6-dehydratase [Acidobacteriota bacterium]
MKVDTARTAVITGGAGFIGSNLAERLLATAGLKVRIFDNLSRAGVVRNLDWLRSKASDNNLEVIEGDVRDAQAVKKAIADATEVYHFAAQVAVTTSVEDPAGDFQVNAQGTLNVLEAARLSGRKPFLLFTSTNKVYGALERLEVVTTGAQYRAREQSFRGVTEDEPLDFHSPYGCSKGTADQYVRDYARIYGLPTVVFRMSCIAGPRQFGTEDQGWVAHFLYSVLGGKRIAIYGDGFQVRDILHVHDLIDAMLLARKHVRTSRGQIYNIGGGMDRAVSILEMLRAIEKRTGKKPILENRAVRPGDQPLYISNTAKMERDTGWSPRRSVADILTDIHAFWREIQSDSETRYAGNTSQAAALGVVA